MRIYFKDDECDAPDGEVIDCPDCGEPATYNDGGITCSNDDCPSNQ